VASCSICPAQSVIENPHYCKEHFIEQFEKRVHDTIEKYSLMKKTDNVVVAVSGGKDSLTVLTLLHKFGYTVTALLINEGIPGYRDHTIEDMKRVCNEKKIPYKILSFEELAGKTLQQMIQNNQSYSSHPCTTCGTLRRYLLAKGSKDFDVIATGHNADDESQAVLMNIIKGNTELFARLGPISGIGQEGFTRRVKPLYFCSEKEIMTYAYLQGLVHGFNECPHISMSYRNIVREELNLYAKKHPAARRELLERFLSFKSSMRVEQAPIKLCKFCEQPSSTGICKACSLIEKMRHQKVERFLNIPF
jgi:uncharacterized protein (TIGR00269 family)